MKRNIALFCLAMVLCAPCIGCTSNKVPDVTATPSPVISETPVSPSATPGAGTQSENPVEKGADKVGDVARGAANGVGDAVKGVGQGVEDVGQGIENAAK